jgi:hypothetical protein
MATSTDVQQAFHWARLAAHHDPTALTILVLPDPHWYHNFDPLTGPFPDIHTILHFEADTLTYKEPTIPIELNKQPRKEPSAFNIYCIHHRSTTMFTLTHIHRIRQILTTLNINNVTLKEAPATP